MIIVFRCCNLFYFLNCFFFATPEGMKKTSKSITKEKCKKSKLNSNRRLRELELEVKEYFANN